MIYKNECAIGTFENIACIIFTWIVGIQVNFGEHRKQDDSGGVEGLNGIIDVVFNSS